VGGWRIIVIATVAGVLTVMDGAILSHRKFNRNNDCGITLGYYLSDITNSHLKTSNFTKPFF